MARWAMLLVATVLTTANAGQAQSSNPWDGAWKGALGGPRSWPVAVRIEKGKVVSFEERGVPITVGYTTMSAAAVTFGDKANYRTKLLRTGVASASLTVRGRHGVENGSLTK